MVIVDLTGVPRSPRLCPAGECVAAIRCDGEDGVVFRECVVRAWIISSSMSVSSSRAGRSAPGVTAGLIERSSSSAADRIVVRA